MIGKKLWVYMSLSAGEPDGMSMALLARAQQLAGENAMALEAVTAGEGSRAAADSLAAMGVQTVYNADVPGLNQCEYMRIADILCPLVKEHAPEVILFPTTDSASILASTLGIRLQTGVIVHCVAAEIRDGLFVGSIPAFGGQAMGEIFCPVKRPQIATVRLSGGAFEPGPAGTVVPIAADAPKTEGLELLSQEAEQSSGIALEEAELVLCGGTGLADTEGWQLLEALADKLGAAVCCTRDAIDMDIGPTERDMVGVSGCTITPKVYVGFGVSGAAHHLLGMKDSGLILNVNKDKSNLFFPASDCGYVGDAKSTLRAMLCALEEG